MVHFINREIGSGFGENAIDGAGSHFHPSGVHFEWGLFQFLYLAQIFCPDS